MSYAVYLVTSIGAPRDHHAIFVETNKDLTGYIYQVTGNIQTGMIYGHRSSNRPEEDSTSFLAKTYIGKVSQADYDRIQPVIEAIPPPSKQFDGPKRINPGVPLRRCQEWTEEAIGALIDNGILQC
jgi:hypothetical protein